MSLDYYAILAQQEYEKGFQGIDYKDIDAVTTRYHVLVATGHKEDKDTGGNALRTAWQKNVLSNKDRPQQQLKHWGLQNFYNATWEKPDIDLTLLCPNSWLLQFTFTLAKPYISRGDNPFYIVDNPIVRDKVFRLPMVRPTAWKGNLYAALWQLGYDKKGDELEQREQMQRLFGIANDTDDTEQSGRLYFYPTFFTQISLEIINPHDRKRRVGTNPILFESVPPGARGTFSLLYVPFDRIGKDEAETRRQVAADLQLLAEGLHAMFTMYGFGAKTSSGFGLAENAVHNGRIWMNISETAQPIPPPAEPQEPPILREFLAQYPNEDFSLKPDAWRKQHSATNAQRKKYKEAREVHRQYQQEQDAYQKALAEWEVQAQNPTPAFLEGEFASLTQLVEETALALMEKLLTDGAT